MRRGIPSASGLASAVHAKDPKFSSRMTVPMIDLDGYSRASGMQPPQLIKIDVEGYEFEAIRGARRLLASDAPPAVVFESQASHFDLAGVSFGEIAAWLDREAGFKVYALLPRGLTAIASPENGPSSTNTLALHPQKHAGLHDALRSYRFRRNQNT